MSEEDNFNDLPGVLSDSDFEDLANFANGGGSNQTKDKIDEIANKRFAYEAKREKEAKAGNMPPKVGSSLDEFNDEGVDDGFDDEDFLDSEEELNLGYFNETFKDTEDDRKNFNKRLKEAKKQEEQKNEKSANKMPNMNFTKVQDYNNSELKNQQKDEKTEIKEEEENLKLNNSSSFESEPELETSSLKTENEGIGIGESLKEKSEKIKLDIDRLKTDEERIKFGNIINDAKNLDNKKQKTTEHSFL